MAKIAMIEGIGKKYSEKLESAGVGTVEALLERGATKNGRKEIAQQANVSEKMILNWVNRADLFRIKGIGSQYADLLENAGVDSVPALAKRNPENLLMKLQQVNDNRHLVRAMPYLKQVRKWVGRAKDLPKVVTH
jgi:predicted flap endonuclease-1-like 5' DNA nuclease